MNAETREIVKETGRYSAAEISQLDEFFSRCGGFSVGGEKAIMAVFDLAKRQPRVTFSQVLEQCEAEYRCLWYGQPPYMRANPYPNGICFLTNVESLRRIRQELELPPPRL